MSLPEVSPLANVELRFSIGLFPFHAVSAAHPPPVSNLSTVTWDHLRSLKALRSLSLTDFEMREPVL